MTNGVFARKDQVDEWQHNEAVDAEAYEDGHDVPGELLEIGGGVLHLDDAFGQDGGDADG